MKQGRKTTLFASVTKQKLQYFGHVARREGLRNESIWRKCLEKLRGKEVEEHRDSGGQRVCSITKLPVYSCYNKAQNCHEWRNYISVDVELRMLRLLLMYTCADVTAQCQMNRVQADDLYTNSTKAIKVQICNYNVLVKT